jgi:aminoacrylate hydrolase
MTEKHYNIGDAEIYTRTLGTGAPLFLVAGLGGRHQFWQKQWDAFAEHFKVILHDHRGVGNSTPDKTVLGAQHMADDLIKLMDAMGIEKATIVGHSTGGAIGQHIALKYPDRLDKLVMSCSWAGPDPYFQTLFQTRRQVLISCGPEAYYLTGTYLATPAWHLQGQIKSARSFLADRMENFPGLEVELSRLSAVMSHDLRSEIHKIAHETLIIGTPDDQITPIGFSHELAEKIPNAHMHALDKGGHFCPMSNSERYNEAVLKFLT